MAEWSASGRRLAARLAVPAGLGSGRRVRITAGRARAGSGDVRGGAAGGMGRRSGSPGGLSLPERPQDLLGAPNNHALQSVAAGDRDAWPQSAFLGALGSNPSRFCRKRGPK